MKVVLSVIFFKVAYGQEGNIGEDEIMRLVDLSRRHALEVMLNKDEGQNAFNRVQEAIGESSLEFLRNPLVVNSLRQQLGESRAEELLSYINEDFVNSNDLATTTGQLEVESNNRVYALTYNISGQNFTTLVKLVKGDQFERFQHEKLITDFFADAFEREGRYIPRYIDLVKMGNVSVGVRTFLASETLFDILVNAEDTPLTDEEKMKHFSVAGKDLAFIHHVGKGLEVLIPKYRAPQEADTHPIERTIDRFSSRMASFMGFDWDQKSNHGETYKALLKFACEPMVAAIANATMIDPVFCKDSSPKNDLVKGAPAHIDYEDELLGCFHQDLARLFEFGINGKEYLTEEQKQELTRKYLKERSKLRAEDRFSSILGEDTNPNDYETDRTIYNFATLQKHLEYIGSSVRDFSRAQDHSRQSRHYERLKFHINAAKHKAKELVDADVYGIAFTGQHYSSLMKVLDQIEEHTRIKALLVDFGGVFFSDGMRDGTQKLEGEYGVSQSDWMTLLKNGEFAQGIRRGEDEDNYWNEILNQECKLPDGEYSNVRDIVSAKEGYDTDVDAKVIERIQELWYGSYQPIKEVRDVVLEAKEKGIKVVGITSNFGSRVRALTEKNNLKSLFDCIVSSHEVGIVKDGDGFYECALERISDEVQIQGLRAGECVTIDDKTKFLLKARADGIHTVPYSDKTKNGKLRKRMQQYHLVDN